MLVADIVIHLLSDAPTKEAALRLPLVSPSPASFRVVDKARLKSATLLTSQSPMSPHVIVAVDVSCTHAVLRVVGVRRLGGGERWEQENGDLVHWQGELARTKG